jgi:hypothetical protein
MPVKRRWKEQLKPRREKSDRQAMEGSEDKGMIVHPRRTTAPQNRRIRIFPSPRLKPLPLIEPEVQWRKSTEAKAAPQRKTVSWADAKAASVQKALSHYRYKTRVHVDTEIHSRRAPWSILPAATSLRYSASTRGNDP